MTQRPGPYERFVDDARLRRARPARARRTRAASTWPRSPSRGCSRSRVDGAVCGPNRAEHLEPVLAARELQLSPDDRDRSAGSSHERAHYRRARRTAAAADGRVHRRDGRRARVRSRAARCTTRCASSSGPPGEASLIGLMPAYRGGDAPLYALKSVAISPANTARGLDPHQGFVALFDGETGETRAIMNAGGDHRDPHRRRLGRRDAGCSRARTRRRSAILGAGHPGRRRTSRRCAPCATSTASSPGADARAGRELDGVEEAATAEEAVRDADVS